MIFVILRQLNFPNDTNNLRLYNTSHRKLK